MTSPPQPASTEGLRAVLELFRGQERFLLAGHVRPDGDCLGAQAALARGLAGLGKDVRILNPDLPERRYDSLGQGLEFEAYRPGRPLPPHDVVCLLDINVLERCGELAAPLREAPSQKVVIDHHPFEGEPWWTAAYLDASASATGVLVWRILKQLDVPVDRSIAEAVFTSIVTDTGWFRYSNTDAETLEIAAELLKTGLDPSALYRSLHQRAAPTEPMAIGRVLQRTEYFADRKIAVVDQPGNCLPGPEDGDPILDLLRAVEPVEVVLYLREIEPGLVKLSARSKGDFDVNRLARRFGGGGHAKAAGATIRGELPAVRQKLVRAAVELLEGRP